MESISYPDSSFLVSIFSQDSNSSRASACVKGLGEPLLFTSLHRIETRNALRNAVALGTMTESDRRAAFRQIDQDLRDGLLLHTPINWTDGLRRADELSQKHAPTNGQRTIDLLHVAFALESDAKTFLSFDNRQRGLAAAAGLNVKP